MSEWISVKIKPKTSCDCWVIHKNTNPREPIKAFFDKERNMFLFGPHNYLLPSSIALHVTHWLLIPEAPK